MRRLKLFEEIEEANAAVWKEKILESKKLVLVEFWHQYCPHCRAIKPVYDELSTEYGDKLKFTKFNVMNNPDNQQLAAKYGVMGTPTFMFFWRKTCSWCCWSTSKRRPDTSNRVHHQKTQRLLQEKYTSKFVLHQLIKWIH